MANTVSMNLSLQAKGIKEANADAALLADNLERAAKASAMLSSGGTAGSKKAAGMGAIPAARARSENEEYNRGRGAMGATGASARDFANQSQGLGGLVRLYATFAANLFAASAAFNALRNAANVTNMVKGLDQLGAASGRNLGSLAKDLVKVTDGAITLQEAMEATAKASAAGMSADSLKRLTTGAKNASQALGLNMSDALSRLTRGVTKLEPELLDELGIFVRVDTAAQKYAQSIGKATSQLTEFERRNAFAVEVLGQVESKFGALNLAANPYDKLLASLKEVAQDGLEIVNKVLGPLVGFMSTSPTALGMAIAGVATLLLKQAIPAIGMFRENAERMAKETHARVLQQVKDQADAAAEMDSIAAMRAERAFEKEASTQKKLQRLRDSEFNKKVLGKDVRNLLLKDPLTLTDTDIATITAKREELAKKQDKISEREVDRLHKWNESYKSILAGRTAAGNKAADASEASDERILSTMKQKEMYLKRLQAAESRSNVVFKASENASMLGPVFALKQLKDNLKDVDGGIAKTVTGIRAGFSIATAAVSTFMNAFGIWFAVGGLAIAGISFLFEKMSATAEESKRTAEGIDSLNSSIENVSRTLDVINKKEPLEALSVQSIQARANALNDLTDSMTNLSLSVQKEISAMNGLDRFLEGFKSLFGGGLVKNFNETLAKSIGKALDLTQKDPKLVNGLESIFGKAIDSSSQLEEELNKLPESLRNEKWNAIVALQKELNLAKNNAASLSTSMVSAFDAANKAQQDFINSFKPTDSQFKLGSSLVASSEAVNKALSDNINTVSELLEITKDPEKLKIFPPELAKEIIGSTKALQDMAKADEQMKKAMEPVDALIADRTQRLAFYKNAVKDVTKEKEKGGAERESFAFITRFEKELREFEKAKGAIRVNFEADSTALNSMLAKIKEATSAEFKSGISLMMASSDAEMSKAGAVFAQGIAAKLGDTKEGVKLRTELAQAQINVQLAVLQASESNILATRENTLAQREATLELRKNSKDLDVNDLRLLNVEKTQIATERDALRNSGSVTASKMESLPTDIREAVLSLRGITAQRISLQGQSKLLNVSAKADLANIDSKTRSEDIKDEIESRRKVIEQLNQTLGINETINLTTLKERQDIEKQISDLEYKNKLLDLGAKLTERTIYLNANRMSVPEDSEIQRLQGNVSEVNASRGKSSNIEAFKQLKELEEASAKNKNIALDKEAVARKLTYEEQLRSLDADAKSLDYLNTIGAVSASFYEAKKADTEIAKINAEYENSVADKRLANTKELNDLEAKKNTLKSSNEPKDIAELASVQALIALKTEQWSKELAGMAAAKTATVGLVELNKQTTVELALQKEAMDAMKTTTESLSAVFGEMGENIGKAAEAMLELSQNADKRKKAEEAAKKDPKVSEEEQEKLRKKHAKEELSDIAKAASANKKMFGEKTAAHKILNGIERAAHAEKMAIQVMEAAAQAKNIADQISSGMKYLGNLQEMIAKDGIAAVIKQGTGGDPWTAIPRMVAMAAFVSSLIGEPVSASIPSGPSNEDMQKAQLTGQAYEGSSLYSTGYGAYGDPTANVKGISDAIDTLGKVFFNNMGNKSSTLLTYLREIQDNTAATVSAIITSSGGAGQLGPGVKVPGESVNSPGAGFASIPVIGGALTSLIDGLFGGSKSYSNLESQNLRIRSANLETVANGQISGFYDSLIKTVTESSFLFWKSTSVNYRNQIDNLDQNVLGKISKIFQAFNASMFEVAKGLGGTEADMLNTLRSIAGNIDINIQGLNGTQIGEALGAQLTLKMNQVVATAFPWVKSLTKAGEEFSAAAARLIKADETIRTGLGLIDQTLEGFNTEQRMRRQQDLLAKFGGSLDEFASSVETYYDKFFSEQDKLDGKYADIRNRMADLGLAGTVTEDQFKALVSSINLTTYAGQTLFKELMDLAPAFDDVAEAIKQVAEERDSLVERMYELTGNTAALKILKRAKILENLDPTNRKLQEYLFALEDMKEAETKLANARKKANTTTINTINSTVSSLEGFIKSIANFRDSLKISVQSPLTPQEKYAEAKSQFDSLLQVVNTVVTPGSDAEKERNDAVNKLQNLATTFLDLSKVYNASSSQYVSDYNMVQSALLSTESILSAQLSDAQIQQTQLQAIIDAEEATTNATVTVADGVTLLNSQISVVAAALQAWMLYDTNASGYSAEAIAISEVPQFASGGYASGLAIVGENGPELVNFTNPGQVYTAEQTSGMFSVNQQLVEEVKQLRAEVQKLREQQNKETGALINATFDAQNRNANTVANAVEDAAKAQIWTAKVQQSVVLV